MERRDRRPLSSPRRLVAWVTSAIASALGAACSLVVDFDSERLPCPCDTDHVCLVGADQCVRRNSVELFKSCSQDTSPPGGDDLCPPGAVCRAVNGQGPRCLPACVPVEYGTVDSGALISGQCPTLTTCWPQSGVGVCAEGVCEEVPNTCSGARERCVSFNGAGVCFKECDIKDANSCGADLVCTVIGQGPVTACVRAGTLGLGALCSSTRLCRKADDSGRTLMCGRPRTVASEPPLRCLPVCFGNEDCPGSRCDVAIADINPFTGEDLGLCAVN